MPLTTPKTAREPDALTDPMPLHPMLTSAAYRAFVHDLPELLRTHHLAFVAYSKDGKRLDLDYNAAALEARLETANQLYHVFYVEPQGLPVGGPSS